MITRIHFDTDAEIGETIKRRRRVQIQIAYLGSNKYNIKAIDLLTEDKKVVCNKQIELPILKGNGRKVFSRLRNFAINIVENKPLDYYRADC